MPAPNERFGARAAVPTRKGLCEIEVCRPHASLLEAAPASSRHHVVGKPRERCRESRENLDVKYIL